MLHNLTKTVLLVFVLALSAGFLMAQPKANSPLSRFGIGDITDVNFASSGSMGGLGASFHHIFQANIVNPASLGFLEATAFELGLFAQATGLKQRESSNTVWSGNLEYISLSIPLVNPINELLERRETDLTWGLNISLLPLSQVGYFVQGEDQIDSIGTVSRNFQGFGGINRFNVGNGWKYQNLAFGINYSYLFGETEYRVETVFNDLFNNFEHMERNASSFTGSVWTFGAQYDVSLKKSRRQNRRGFTLGAYFNTNTSFTSEGDYLNYVQNPFFGTSDTARYEIDVQSEGTLPGELGFGIRFEEATKWSIGINYSATNWSDYVNEARPETLNDSWRFSGGVGFTPDFSSISSFFDRVEYRAGAYYQTDPRSLNGEQVTQYAVTAGMGLPFVFQRFFSFVNIGFEYGHRGDSDSLKENYLRARIGITLNDNRWFIKRRFN